jgi:hypothetical protein
MENPHAADDVHVHVPERDVLAMIAMIDYLVAEVSRIDAMSAQCLVLARKSLAETVADALVRAH